jgi:hypothetical protein
MREIGYARRKAHAQAVPGEEYETQLITRGAIQMSSALAAPVVSPAPALSSLALDRESRWLLHHSMCPSAIINSVICHNHVQCFRTPTQTSLAYTGTAGIQYA